MMRWLALLLLIASGSGCAMMEDAMFGPETYAIQAPPQSGTCYQPTVAASAPQTAEPPR